MSKCTQDHGEDVFEVFEPKQLDMVAAVKIWLIINLLIIIIIVITQALVRERAFQYLV